MSQNYSSPTIEQVGGADVVDGYRSLICHLAPASDDDRVKL